MSFTPVRSLSMVALGAALAAGCFPPALDDDIEIQCANNDECPSGRTCQAERCVPNDALDVTPPTIADVSVAPALAAPDTTVVARFTASEALFAEVVLAIEPRVSSPGLPT